MTSSKPSSQVDLYVIGLYQRTTENPYKGWRWTAAANPTSSYKHWLVWDDGQEPDDEDFCAVEPALSGTRMGGGMIRLALSTSSPSR